METIACIFCDIINHKIPSKTVYEDEFTFAFLDINPVSDGHVVVIPKHHTCCFSKADREDITHVAETTHKIAQHINKVLQPAGINYLINEGEMAGQQVFHYHQHIIPKYHANEGFCLTTNSPKLSDLETIWNKIKF